MCGCSVRLCYLICIIILVTIRESVLAAIIKRAKFNQPVTLPCETNCPGVTQWTMSDKPNEPLSRCDPTSCSSKEGFNISHDQYLNGDLSLSISAADYSKRTWYICRCKGKDVCEVRLSIEPLISSVQKCPGEDLLLDLSISDPVELIYNSRESVGSSGHRICMVEEAVLRCNPEYIQRASLNHTVIILREVTLNDSGVYIIQDFQEEIIHIYTVTVEEEKLDKDQESKCSVPPWSVGVIVVLVVLVVLLLISVEVLWKKNKHLRRSRCLHQESKSREWRGRCNQCGVNMVEETAFMQEPDGTSQTNGERVQKLNSSISVEDHQGSGGSEWRPRLRTSYAELVNYILELDALVERHSSGAVMDQICSNSNCTIEIKQLRRNIEKFKQQRLSVNITGMMEQFRNERDRLDKIEVCCRKRKEELDSLMQQHRKGPTKGHKRGNSEDWAHIFSSVE